MEHVQENRQARNANLESTPVHHAEVEQLHDVPTVGTSGKTCAQLALEVVAGKWGEGWNRKHALNSAYGEGTYDQVQCMVDMMNGLDGC